MAESYYVKCENCGRRLPGPQRSCDVCGGKMTRRTEESYYTPQGIISKGHYDNQVRKTADRGTGSKAGVSSKRPKNMKPDPLKNIGKAFTDIKQGLSDAKGDTKTSDSGNSKSFYSSKNKKTVGSYAVALVIGIVMVISFAMEMADDASDFGVDYNDPDSYYDDYDAYETINPDESIEGDGYILKFDQISLYGDDVDVGSEGMDIFIELEITDEDMEINPFSCMAIEVDGAGLDDLAYVNIYNDYLSEDEMYYNNDEVAVLEVGEVYSVILNYASVPQWTELKLIHNFGGLLPDRDTTTDITYSR